MWNLFVESLCGGLARGLHDKRFRETFMWDLSLGPWSRETWRLVKVGPLGNLTLYVEPELLRVGLYVEPEFSRVGPFCGTWIFKSGTFLWNRVIFRSGTLMWNLRKLEPLSGTRKLSERALDLEPWGTCAFMYTVRGGTFMCGLAEPGCTFWAAAQNPEAILEEPQASEAVGGKRKHQNTVWGLLSG